MRRMPTDAEWVAGRIADLPSQWGVDLVRQWERQKDRDYYGANVTLREATKPFMAEPLPLDASDATICDAAKKFADWCFSRAELFNSIPELRASMERICVSQGIEPPNAETADQPAIARMTCELWWRRKLRRRHGRAVEAAAIRLGRVSRRGDLYVSNEGLRARQQQNARNAATLEATLVRNELGQEYTLAELQAKSTSNKRIKRSELMTRMAGFEKIADKEGHAGLFLTMTCPSRFHRFRTVNQGKVVIDNPNYRPEATPAEGQAHLVKVWSRIRAELKRKGFGVYGFRIAEPQHDGTPHWHMLLFCLHEHATLIERIVWKQALKDSPDETGAREHRCDFKRIDKAKGSATGYIAKYIAKNIDGAHIEVDLEGCPGEWSAQRVEAWAARWNIRQFQQIGGPAVGVWRELRRVKKIDADAPECLHVAHKAANKREADDESEGTGAAWDAFCEAQGGVFCGRDTKIKLLMEQPEAMGRYGEQQAPRPVGVWVPGADASPASQDGAQRRDHPSASPADDGTAADSADLSEQAKRGPYEIRSIRHKWEVLRASRSIDTPASSLEGAQPSPPWTCVNNCTSPFRAKSPLTHHPVPNQRRLGLG